VKTPFCNIYEWGGGDDGFRYRESRQWALDNYDITTCVIKCRNRDTTHHGVYLNVPRLVIIGRDCHKVYRIIWDFVIHFGHIGFGTPHGIDWPIWPSSEESRNALAHLIELPPAGATGPADTATVESLNQQPVDDNNQDLFDTMDQEIFGTFAHVAGAERMPQAAATGNADSAAGIADAVPMQVPNDEVPNDGQPQDGSADAVPNDRPAPPPQPVRPPPNTDHLPTKKPPPCCPLVPKSPPNIPFNTPSQAAPVIAVAQAAPKAAPCIAAEQAVPNYQIAYPTEDPSPPPPKCANPWSEADNTTQQRRVAMVKSIPNWEAATAPKPPPQMRQRDATAPKPPPQMRQRDAVPPAFPADATARYLPEQQQDEAPARPHQQAEPTQVFAIATPDGVTPRAVTMPASVATDLTQQAQPQQAQPQQALPRLPPFMHENPGDIPQEEDYEWTENSRDRNQTLANRDAQNNLILQHLQSNRNATCRSGGWSLCPLMHPNDQFTMTPTGDAANQVVQGDLVFCRCQSFDTSIPPFLITHLVLQKTVRKDKSCVFHIGNLDGMPNGTATAPNVFGKCSLINNRAYETERLAFEQSSGRILVDQTLSYCD